MQFDAQPKAENFWQKCFCLKIVKFPSSQQSWNKLWRLNKHVTKDKKILTKILKSAKTSFLNILLKSYKVEIVSHLTLAWIIWMTSGCLKREMWCNQVCLAINSSPHSCKSKHSSLIYCQLHLSLKIQYIEFDITVLPCKLYVENLTLKITMRPYNSVQMSILCSVSMYCTPMIT